MQTYSTVSILTPTYTRYVHTFAIDMNAGIPHGHYGAPHTPEFDLDGNPIKTVCEDDIDDPGSSSMMHHATREPRAMGWLKRHLAEKHAMSRFTNVF